MIIPGYTNGYVGSAPDIGCFEYGATPWIAGASAATNVYAAAVPAAPLDLAAASPAASQMDLTWQNNDANATSCVVQWAADEAFTPTNPFPGYCGDPAWTAIVCLPGSAASYVDTTLGAGYYRVCTYNGSYLSTYSNYVYASSAPVVSAGHDRGGEFLRRQRRRRQRGRADELQRRQLGGIRQRQFPRRRQRGRAECGDQPDHRLLQFDRRRRQQHRVLRGRPFGHAPRDGDDAMRPRRRLLHDHHRHRRSRRRQRHRRRPSQRLPRVRRQGERRRERRQHPMVRVLRGRHAGPGRNLGRELHRHRPRRQRRVSTGEREPILAGLHRQLQQRRLGAVRRRVHSRGRQSTRLAIQRRLRHGRLHPVPPGRPRQPDHCPGHHAGRRRGNLHGHGRRQRRRRRRARRLYRVRAKRLRPLLGRLQFILVPVRRRFARGRPRGRGRRARRRGWR